MGALASIKSTHSNAFAKKVGKVKCVNEVSTILETESWKYLIPLEKLGQTPKKFGGNRKNWQDLNVYKKILPNFWKSQQRPTD